MNFDAFNAMVLALPGATFDVKWGSDRTYCVGGKMFSIAGQVGQAAPRYMFKASELGFEMLTESGAAEPAPYLGRAKWVRLKANDSLPDEALISYVREAHTLIAAKLTKKARAALGIG